MSSFPISLFSNFQPPMVLDQDVPTVEFKFKITMGIIPKVFIWGPLLVVNKSSWIRKVHFATSVGRD